MIVVQLQRADTSGIGAEGQHEDIAHQPHVLVDVLRHAVGRARLIRFGQRGPPALQPLRLAGLVDPLLHFPDGREIFVEPAPVRLADLVAQALRFLADGIEHALVGPADFIAEEAIEGEGMEVLGLTSYGDLTSFAQQASRASCFILSIDDD